MTTDRKTLSVRTDTHADDAGSAPRLRNASSGRLDRLNDRAREMRRNPTEAEALLWARLARAQLGGFKFFRQKVVATSVVDFACPSRWLVVEISDASSNPEIDVLQDRKLTESGVRVLRFAEAQVIDDVDSVAAAILAELHRPTERGRQGAR